MSRLYILCAALVACAAFGGCKSNSVVAVDDVATVTQSQAANIDVLSNDSNPDARPLMVKKIWGAQKGDVVINPDNTLTYTPKPGELGTDTFHYGLKDNKGNSSDALVKVDIVPPPMPVASAAAADTLVVKPRTSEQGSGQVMGSPETLPSQSGSDSSMSSGPPRGPFVQSVMVHIRTTANDKGSDEPIRILVKIRDEILADRTVGAGDLWNSFTDRNFELQLSPMPSIGDAANLTLEIRKIPIGAPNGGGWTMQAEAIGKFTDNSTILLLPMTESVKLGEEAPSERSWTLRVGK